jgi:hypothetical protein
MLILMVLTVAATVNVMTILIHGVVEHFNAVKCDNPEDLCDLALGHILKLTNMLWHGLKLL